MTTLDERPVSTQRTVNDLPRPRTDWDRDSACSGIDDVIFLEARFRKQATRICGTCPVRWDCLMDVVRIPEDKAIRAAMTPRERTEWLREEGIEPAPAFDARHVGRMIAAKASWDDIAQVYGVTADTMQKRWKRHLDGTERKPRPRTPGSGPKPIPIDTDQARELLNSGGTLNGVAAAFHVSRNTLVRALKRAAQP